MYEFIEESGRSIDSVGVGSVDRFMRFVQWLQRLTIHFNDGDSGGTALEVSIDGNRLARSELAFESRGLATPVAIGAVTQPMSVRLPYNTRSNSVEIEFGAEPWRIRLKAPMVTDGNVIPHRGGKPLDCAVPRLPVESVFRIRVHNTFLLQDFLTVSLSFEEGSWTAHTRVKLVAEAGDFMVSQPILLLGTQQIDSSLSSAFPGFILLAGLGGVEGSKPKKAKVVRADPAETPTDGEPAAKAVVDGRIFRADDNGAIWGEFFAGNVSWGAEETRAVKEGWEDADENSLATKEEILDHLNSMDGDDIWIYSGHLGFRDPDDPSISTVLPHYLAGWDLDEYKLISRDELETAMAGQPPGVAVLAGCMSWEMRDVFKGSKIFAGITSLCNDLESDAAAKVFMQALCDGNTVAEAELKADNFFSTAWRNRKEHMGTFKVQCADKSKTIYELLNVDRKRP